MTAATCACCGEKLPEASGTGRPARFINDAHRKAYARGARPRVSGSATAEAPADDQMPGDVRKLGQRRSYAADCGDGDRCPQDPDHGRMYLVAGKKRQWCPNSAHRGNPHYLYDGVTRYSPAAPAGPDLASPLLAGVKQGQGQPGPSVTDDGSPPPAVVAVRAPRPSASSAESVPGLATVVNQPRAGTPVGDVGDGQLALPLAVPSG